ncbi:hypothetical protein AB0333_06410 [Citricoccus sp. NPDC079358]|jgi:integrase|uniref:Phage integrase family domain protein n=1 Tax=Paenarthrobacter aurescens (strain TC1) TaxID=290340 RepID=A1R4K4_PAEAT|nr:MULTISPECIES: phage integrase family protein [Micrococcaceae]ABM06519.1 phage integrase family domain protein [Paenarthrobacter aurescens TC1]MDP9985905.1 integrase [Arthrobacter oryzae]
MILKLSQRPSPIDDDVVLARRPLRDDTSPGALTRFADTVWDLTPGIFEDHSQKYSINFRHFPPAWQQPVKAYLWTLINDETPRPVPGGPSAPKPLALSSIAQLPARLRRIISWFDEHGHDSLQAASPQVLDRFLAELGETNLGFAQKRQIITETRRLWAYRDLVPPKLRLPDGSPWHEETARDLLSHRRKRTGNLTPRIGDETLVPLLSWALRFIEDFAPDITAAYHEYCTLLGSGYRHTPAGARETPVPDSRKTALRAVLKNLRAHGLSLPGQPGPDGEPIINWAHLARLTGFFGSTHARWDRDILAGSGLSVDSNSYLMARCTAQLDGRLWHGSFIAWEEAVPLAVHLQTACFIVIAYLSGMRPGEVLSLKRDCHRQDPRTNLHELHGTRWKGARNHHGAKIPEGQARQNPWIVHPLAALAIDVLERLHSMDLLFPRTLRPQALRGTTPRTDRRAGNGQTAAKTVSDITSFIHWVNEYCARRQRSDCIPDDPDGRITPSRFRRTLAWHIARRPRGLVAAAIQYGHVADLVTQGYSGSYDSGFPNELAMERWLERIERITDIDQYLDAGGHVSGPAADKLRERTGRATAKFAGRPLPTRRQAEKLLQDPSLQIFKGDGLHCVFDQATALCARQANGPDLGRCRSACANIARTDTDILQVQASRDLIAQDRLAPPIRYERIRQVGDRLTGIINNHEQGRQ